MSETTKRKRGEQPAKTPEQRQQERRQRFLTHAERRVNNVLKRMVQVARLGNRANYQYTDDEAKKIAETIMDSAVAVRDAFLATGSDKPQFRL